MISRTTTRFREALAALPAEARRRARTTFETWRRDPTHPSLRFKQVHPTRPIYSVRIGLGWRALGVRQGNEIIWFWIGSHADYDKTITQM